MNASLAPLGQHRFLIDNMTETSDKQLNRTYSVAFKRKAIKLAKQSKSVAAAARKLKIPADNLRYWLKTEQTKSAISIPKQKIIKKKHKPQPRRTYSAAFKLAAIQRASEINIVAETARELKIATQTLHNWIEAAKAGRIGTTLNFDHDELRELQQACADRMVTLKSESSSNPEKMKILRAISAKLKRQVL